MKKILYTVILLGVISVSAQKVPYKWEAEYCKYESVFDGKKYTKIQIGNCYRLLDENNWGLEKLAWIFEKTDLEKLDVSILDNEYKEKREALKNLIIPNIQFWKDLQKARLRYMDEIYEIGRLEYLAVDNAGVLKLYKPENAAIQKYAKALTAGGDELIKVWLELREEMAKRNGRPETVKKETKKRLASRDKLLYAKVDVLVFGWWNTAVQNIYRGTEDPAFIYDISSVEFQKLFLEKIKSECEEP